MSVIENSSLLDLIDKRIEKYIKDYNFPKEIPAIVTKVPDITIEDNDSNKIGYAYVRFVNDSEYTTYEPYTSNYAYGSGRDIRLINKTGEALSVGDNVWVSYTGLLTADSAYISRRNGVDYSSHNNSLSSCNALEYVYAGNDIERCSVSVKTYSESENFSGACTRAINSWGFDSCYASIFLGYPSSNYSTNKPSGYSGRIYNSLIAGANNFSWGKDLCDSTSYGDLIVDSSVISGTSNIVHSIYQSIVTGQSNRVHTTYDGAFVSGYNNQIKYASSSSITGQYNKVTSSAYQSLIAGANCNISSIYSSLSVGAYNNISSIQNSLVSGSNITIPTVGYSVISGMNYSGTGSCYECIIGGASHNLGDYLSYSLVVGNGANLVNKTSDVKELTDSGIGGIVIGGSGNAFIATGKGNVYITGQYSSSGADYAESFEWLDGNTSQEDRRGRFVVLQGNYIRYATKFDDKEDVLGVISANPSVIGDAYEGEWCNKYETDVFGTPIYEEKTEEIKLSEGKTETHTVLVKKLSEDYDEAKEYVSRSQRPEYDYVGVLGKLVVVDDGTCEENGYCYPNVEGIATKTTDKTKGFKVMKRIDETHIRVWIK